MLEWFERHAPIRQKFRTLLIVHGALSFTSLLAVVWAAWGDGGVPALALATAILIATLVVVSVSGRMISGSYVSAVMRMEALAEGDLDSPIEYQHYSDCVGRIARGMNVFRNQAVRLRKLSAEQSIVVSALDVALAGLARADLTTRITTPFGEEQERLRHAFNSAMERLGETIAAVGQSSGAIASAASQIRVAADDLSSRTEQQAASLRKASGAMGETTALVSQNSAALTEVNQSIADAHTEASKGGRVVEDAVSAMTMIQQSSQEISQIINVIDGIAFQTNLLALNAGVEAARAGEAGRGFAVVATEVRALAQRSAEAAREIKDLITTSGRHVDHGVTLVGETGQALGQIVARVGAVRDIVDGIAASARRQSDMLNEVGGAVADLDAMTQQNAAMVEETTAAASALSEEAQKLAGDVARFELGRRGAAAPSRPAPAPCKLAAAPPVAGNLALVPGNDWSDF